MGEVVRVPDSRSGFGSPLLGKGMSVTCPPLRKEVKQGSRTRMGGGWPQTSDGPGHTFASSRSESPEFHPGSFVALGQRRLCDFLRGGHRDSVEKGERGGFPQEAGLVPAHDWGRGLSGGTAWWSRGPYRPLHWHLCSWNRVEATRAQDASPQEGHSLQRLNGPSGPYN